MKLSGLFNRSVIIYLVRFFVVFCIAYFGTIAVEGLATPINHYSFFIDHYLDYPSWLRASLLSGTRFFTGLFGYKSFIPDAYHIQMIGGKSVQLIYDCLGIGVMSFWLAFVIANKGSLLRKITWIMVGMICIWLINLSRISLFLIAVNTDKPMPLGIDNHTFFNICAYIALFVLIYFYDKNLKNTLIENQR